MPVAAALFLAQAGDDRSDYFRRWAETMREYRGSGILFLSVVGVLVVAFIVLRWVAARSTGDGRRMADNPMAVFHALIAQHELGRGESRLLQDVAASHRLVDPGVLFARPTVFDRCLEEYVQRIDGDALRLQAESEVVRLRDRLFGGIDPIPTDRHSPAATGMAATAEADDRPLLDQASDQQPALER